MNPKRIYFFINWRQLGKTPDPTWKVRFLSSDKLVKIDKLTFRNVTPPGESIEMIFADLMVKKSPR